MEWNTDDSAPTFTTTSSSHTCTSYMNAPMISTSDTTEALIHVPTPSEPIPSTSCMNIQTSSKTITTEVLLPTTIQNVEPEQCNMELEMESNLDDSSNNIDSTDEINVKERFCSFLKG